jgi:hypothetical protein
MMNSEMKINLIFITNINKILKIIKKISDIPKIIINQDIKLIIKKEIIIIIITK